MPRQKYKRHMFCILIKREQCWRWRREELVLFRGRTHSLAGLITEEKELVSLEGNDCNIARVRGENVLSVIRVYFGLSDLVVQELSACGIGVGC